VSRPLSSTVGLGLVHRGSIIGTVQSRDCKKREPAVRRHTATSAGARKRWSALLLLALLAGCTAGPFQPSQDALPREQSRWVPVTWKELPGWQADSVQAAWPALRSSCQRPAQGWARVCATLQHDSPRNDAQARSWLMQNLQPYRVESLAGASTGLITGYYEPSIDARRLPNGAFRVALFAPPADLAARRPYWTREQLDTLPAAQAALRGRQIAYVADPLDALVLQIQGSGRLRVTEPDGTLRITRLAYAGHNDHPYRSVGRWLIDQGELEAGQASWPAIKDWALRNPARVNELLWANPRYVFFREEPLPDPALGPRGAMGVPLTPGRSIAVDPKSVPYGTPVWIDTTEPLANTPLRRLVLAQDTGSAIVGAVRADYFWGWDAIAAEQAGRMRQTLRMWVLWPRQM
jgi:membrane-bound lytic murein transglycosylase A